MTHDELLFARRQQVLSLARREAERLHHHYVGAEHLLLGMITLGRDTAFEVLQKLGLQLETVRAELEKRVGTGSDATFAGNRAYNPRFKKVLALAGKQARGLNHRYVGTEHLLLGLVFEGKSVPALLLTELGVTFERTRLEVLKQLDPNFTPLPPASVSSQNDEPDGILFGWLRRLFRGR